MPNTDNTETPTPDLDKVNKPQIPQTPLERDLANSAPPFATGPNVDNGLHPGLVTVDPNT